MRDDRTTLTLTTTDGRYEVSVADSEMRLTRLIDELLRPVLRAAGFGDELIDMHLGSLDEVDESPGLNGASLHSWGQPLVGPGGRVE